MENNQAYEKRKMEHNQAYDKRKRKIKKTQRQIKDLWRNVFLFLVSWFLKFYRICFGLIFRAYEWYAFALLPNINWEYGFGIPKTRLGFTCLVAEIMAFNTNSRLLLTFYGFDLWQLLLSLSEILYKSDETCNV